MAPAGRKGQQIRPACQVRQDWPECQDVVAPASAVPVA